MKNIILTGFMGTGKTTVGRLLAKRLGFAFVDSDEYIENKAGMRIADIFKQFGEPYFRDIESNCIRELADMPNRVIATGGGVVLKKENIEILKRNGIIVNLNANINTILNHVAFGNDRPLIKWQSPEQVAERLEARRACYADCDFMVDIDNLNPMEVTGEIMKVLELKGGIL